MEVDNIRRHDVLSHALEVKDAAHPHSLCEEAAHDLVVELEGAFASPRPAHERLDKLLAMQGSLKAAHIEVAPEEQLWREEVDEAMK
ncbi:hypothetical protein HT031_005633 [Scenedesmus sp. PABB004]|nr:hypothetical protein HT031_005633 [Scenedesmus sp. PABB004]